jgi:hypothetical protein
LAGTLSFVEKICQRAALFWFGLQDIGIFYSQAVIQRTIVDFPVFFGARFSGKDCSFVPIQTVIRTSRMLDSCLSVAAQNFEVFSKIHLKKIKNILYNS